MAGSSASRRPGGPTWQRLVEAPGPQGPRRPAAAGGLPLDSFDLSGAARLNHALLTPLLRLGESLGHASLRHGGFTPHDLLTVNGRLRVWDGPGHGRGPTLVVLHGIGSCVADYAPLLRAQQGRAQRVLAVELPGHGHSSAPRPPSAAATVAAVRHALARLLHGPHDLLGHSLGGYVAMQLALTPLPGLRRVLLACPDGGPFSTAERDALRHSLTPRSLAEAHALAARTFPGHSLLAWGLAPFIWSRMCDAGTQRLLGTDVLQPVMRPAELRALGARLGRHCLVLWAGNEQLLLPSNLAYLRQHLGAAVRVQRVAGVGHGALPNAPPTLLAPIDAFLR